MIRHPLQHWRRAVIAFLAIGVAVAAAADSWLPPDKRSYFSADKHLRFTVLPRSTDGLDFYSRKVEGKELAGGAAGTPVARLEKLRADGRPQLLWTLKLVNEVAPTDALIANSGAYVVTFDNWFSTGYGPDVVVIYGADGQLIRSLALTDLLSQNYIDALPHSVSSLQWSGDHILSDDGLSVVLRVGVPSQGDSFRSDTYIDLPIRLADGQPVGRDAAAWCMAEAQADRVAAAKHVAEKKERDFFIMALTAPENTEAAWHGYLREAFFRLDPAWKDDFPEMTVLRMPMANDYAVSKTWVRDSLTDKDKLGGAKAFASLSSDNLVAVFNEILLKKSPGTLKGRKVYVAIDAAHHVAVRNAFARSGVTLVLIDPAQPIPQRPERAGRWKVPVPRPAAELARDPLGLRCASVLGGMARVPAGAGMFERAYAVALALFGGFAAYRSAVNG